MTTMYAHECGIHEFEEDSMELESDNCPICFNEYQRLIREVSRHH